MAPRNGANLFSVTPLRNFFALIPGRFHTVGPACPGPPDYHGVVSRAAPHPPGPRQSFSSWPGSVALRWTELPVGPFKARTVFTYVDEIGGETLGSNPSHSLDERIARIAVPKDLRERRSNRQGYVGHPARLGPRRSRSTIGRPDHVRRKVRAPPAAPATLTRSVSLFLRSLFYREDAPFSSRRRRSYLCSSPVYLYLRDFSAPPRLRVEFPSSGPFSAPTLPVS